LVSVNSRSASMNSASDLRQKMPERDVAVIVE
jgi:hypothetical protein